MNKSADQQSVSKLQTRFYEDKSFLLLLLAACLMAIGGAMVQAIFYEQTIQPVPQYFPTTVDHKLIAPEVLSEQGVTPPELLEWSVQAILASFSFNFVDYQQTIQKNRRYYSNAGFQFYEKALLGTNTLLMVTRDKYVVSAVPYAVPEIRSERIGPNGVYTWQIRLPIVATFQNARQMTTRGFIVNMGVVRVPITESPKGVAISAMIVSEGKL